MLGVLLVDDEQFVRMGLRSMIDWRSCGYEIVGEADNGEDALQMIEEIRPDLVITDIRMPVLDGLELVRRVNLANHFPTKFVIISGYNEFTYAQQAMRYGVSDFILKPVDQNELQMILSRVKGQIARDRLISNKANVIWTNTIFEALLKGELNHVEIGNLEHVLGIQKAERLYYVIIEIFDDNVPNGNSSKILPENGLRDKLGYGISKISGFRDSIFLYEHDRYRYGMIVTDRNVSQFLGSEERFASALQNCLSEIIGKDIAVYLGSPVSHIEQIHEAYLTAKEALRYKFVHPGKAIIYGKVAGHPLKYIELEPDLKKQLLEAVDENNKERIGMIVEKIFDTFSKCRFAPEAVRTSINQCIFSVVRLIRELDGREDFLESMPFVTGWQELNIAPEALRQYLLAFLLESAGYIAELRTGKNAGFIQKIKSYIDLHFCEDISLKSLGATFYINPTYLGQLFKKTYGVHFREYLLQLRIDEAKRLLRQTDLCIYEIAERVGFNMPEYFITQFEKIVGMKPTEYRNRLIKCGRAD